MFMIDYKDVGWRYWFVTAAMLTVGMFGNSLGFQIAIGCTVVHLLHFIIRTQSMTVFSVQVRIAYLLLLVVAFAEPLRLLYWIPTVGTWALLLFGYCTMARVVSLLPWNRDEDFSLALVKRTFFSPPVRGNLMEHRLGSQPAERPT